MNLRRLLQQQGQGIIEFVVIFPIFVFLLFAVVDGGLVMSQYNDINNAAKEGARLGAVQYGDGAAAEQAVIDRIRQQAHGRLSSLSTKCTDVQSGGQGICVQWISGPDGEDPGEVGGSVRVWIRYHYKFLTPLVNTMVPWTIEVCAIQREERAVDAPPSAPGVVACPGASVPTPTSAPPTSTPVVPTATPVTPTSTAVPPTSTAVPPTNTPAPPTPVPTCAGDDDPCEKTATAIAKTATAIATHSATPVPTNTPVPTATPCPSGNSGNNCRKTATSIARTATAAAD